MNFAQMLQQPVTPLSRTKPCEEIRKQNPALRELRLRLAQNANEAKKRKAMEKYKAHMQDWIRTRTLENRLGVTRSCCQPILTKWLEQGLVERRKFGPADQWGRSKGYEWRWIGP